MGMRKFEFEAKTQFIFCLQRKNGNSKKNIFNIQKVRNNIINFVCFNMF